VPTKPRILFFVHDGGGLGHLRRLSRIAAALDDRASCMFLSGHRATSWIVPDSCEYVHIPTFDSLLPKRAIKWGRTPFLNFTKPEAIAFRSKFIQTTFDVFKPDIFVSDFLPLGKFEELYDPLISSTAIKVLVLRGILDHPIPADSGLFAGRAEAFLADSYSSILVACDRRICNVETELRMSPKLTKKLSYIGYVSPSISDSDIACTRAERGLSKNSRWVVCSAGSGKNAEALILSCIEASTHFPAIFFDIVAGPSSRISIDSLRSRTSFPRIRLHREEKNLPIWHAAADFVVSEGGYNSLVESIAGCAQIIVCPVQQMNCYEQLTHAKRLSAFSPISVLENPDELKILLHASLGRRIPAHRPLRSHNLDFAGAETAARSLLSLRP